MFESTYRVALLIVNILGSKLGKTRKRGSDEFP